ncbi:helix-turn-helix transcriptional regulator [Thaumasiovibrio subtropicus]|uniref:helix-turn-helix transcriptional regulator n=1 Tax=Thaumasiovibrio subtropicus TaxID=1891207 RepID=UPI000B34CD5C|nr:helix-turn-helix domain-containing protein [Thaumasiovibrio subtropicus]
MRPHIENITSEHHFNWKIREFACKVEKKEFMCPWHYHSEYELVIYRDEDSVFNGSYFAGDAIGPIDHNTMLLYGPGLPHMLGGSTSVSEQKPYRTLILWFTHSWIAQLQASAPELKMLSAFIRRASHGLKFSRDASEHVYQLLSGHESRQPHHQLLRILEALMIMAEDAEAIELSKQSYSFNQNSSEDEQFKRVEAARQFIEDNYQAPIKINDLCRKLHMSESSAYRLFERHFCESFSEHLKGFRIGKACELLVNSQVPVSLVAEQVGFNNLSNFNRQFKMVKGMTPSHFRTQFNR